MPQQPHEANATADLIEVLGGLVRIADLPLKDLERLGSAYVRLAEADPGLANRVSNYSHKAGLVLGCRDIKDGEPGTWKQRTDRRTAEVNKLIADRRARR